MIKLDRKTVNRGALFVMGVFIHSLGIALSMRADVGVTAAASIPHLFTFFTDIPIGMLQFAMNVTFILLQLILLGREFGKRHCLQIVVAFLSSFTITIAMAMTKGFDTQTMTLLQRVLLYCASLPVVAFGLYLISITRSLMMPGEGVALAIAQKLHTDYGRGKVIMDCSCLAFTITVSFAVLHRMASVNVGTVVSALTVGNIISLYDRLLKDNRFVRSVRVEKQETAENLKQSGE